jgi:Helix-hairpin-helix domain
MWCLMQKCVNCVLPRWITTSRGAKPHKPNMEDLWLGCCISNKTLAVSRLVPQPGPRPHDFTTNQKVADLFRTLSNLQQSCPLMEGDSWKAYSSRVVAGRIMHLDFEITNDRMCFNRLLKVSGIGQRTVAKIQEYFERGTFDRIVEFEKDPLRVAMKNMMGIWGVGEKTVSVNSPLLHFFCFRTHF